MSGAITMVTDIPKQVLNGRNATSGRPTTVDYKAVLDMKIKLYGSRSSWACVCFAVCLCVFMSLLSCMIYDEVRTRETRELKIHLDFLNRELEKIKEESFLDYQEGSMTAVENDENSISSHPIFGRMKRAPGTSRSGSGELPNCPRSTQSKKNPVPIYVHLQGNGNTQYNTNIGYIIAWKEAGWCKYQNDKKPVLYDKPIGGLKVAYSGIYMIYAQITFLKIPQIASYFLYAHSLARSDEPKRLLAECYVRSMNEVYQPVSCSISTVACLNSEDRVYLFQPEKNYSVIMDFDTSASFFGLYRLYGSKNGQLSCPVNKSER